MARICHRCGFLKEEESFSRRKNSTKRMAFCTECMIEERSRAKAKRDLKLLRKSQLPRRQAKNLKKEKKPIQGGLKCWRCLRVNLSQSQFDQRKDGTYKTCCRSCCNHESAQFKAASANNWGRGPNAEYSISKLKRGKEKIRKARKKLDELDAAVVRLQAQSDKSFTDPKYAITLIDSQYNGMSYASRNLTLKLMGFENYGQYLGSDLWDRVRKKVFASKGTRCWLCPGRGTQIHHNRYHLNDLVGKVIDFMFPICDPCHHLVEFDAKGEKRHLHQAMPEFNNRAIAWMESKYGSGIT